MILAEAVSQHNDFLLSGLIAVVIGIGKAVDKLFEWRSEKKKSERRDRDRDVTVTAKLDEDTSRLLREAASFGASVAGVVLVKDQNGTPMVYFPRQVGEDTRDIAIALRDVSLTQERTVHVLERIESTAEDTNRKVAFIVGK